MRKHVFRRFVLFTLLYCSIFILLASVQFSRQGVFTRRLGDIMVSGQYRLPADNELPLAPDEYLLDGNVFVSFGGIDFGMVNGRNGRFFHLITEDGIVEVLPERMLISESSINFIFPGGNELEFLTRYIGDLPEMRITGTFQDEVTGIELPFRLMRRTQIRNRGVEQLVFHANGTDYSFRRSNMDVDRLLLIVGSSGIIYGAIPDRRIFSPYDFIITQAESAEAYYEELAFYWDQLFSLWNSMISQQTSEDLIIALASQAIERGNYRAVITAAQPAFSRSPNRTYISSVYFGGLAEAQLSLIAQERDKLNSILRHINSGALEFLTEPRVFEYLAVRGHFNIFDAGAALLRSIDPDSISLDLVPGILEGYIDWMALRPGEDNPFEHLLGEVFMIISESLQKNTLEDRVFVFRGTHEDNEFNLRLGQALLAHAENIDDQTWAGIGRSLILSAFAWDMDEASGGETSARLYRIFNPDGTQARALPVSRMPDHIWAWTSARQISSVFQNDVLNISVDFPVGETHYMIIRGVRPFSRIQLYNLDFRTDPRFEVYDSSGWSYNPDEQTLLVKMQHRSQVENIRIIFREPPRPVVVVPDPVIEDNDDSDQDITLDG